ncbi:hypothetical protein HN903_02045 [archaeon]|jgi:hypothetical protein|nr:hypothetical protein [archaeon]MBT7128514.1 hypothetical protein [archaeon]
MTKIGLVIFVLFVGILLGGILQEYVCHINETGELGSGKPMVDLTCKILSIPLELILLIFAISGAIIYYIKTKE